MLFVLHCRLLLYSWGTILVVLSAGTQWICLRLHLLPFVPCQQPPNEVAFTANPQRSYVFGASLFCFCLRAQAPGFLTFYSFLSNFLPPAEFKGLDVLFCNFSFHLSSRLSTFSLSYVSHLSSQFDLSAESKLPVRGSAVFSLTWTLCCL